MEIIRLVIFVKEDSFRGVNNQDILKFFPLSASIYLKFSIFYHVIYENICDDY